MRVCPDCREENSDRARFCQNCGTSLGAEQPLSGESRRVVSIVFADVTGSTAIGERLDPEPLRRLMSRYFDEMEKVISSHGGTVEKFIGDAVMAVFGIPRLHEDDALRAVRAAQDMRTALDELHAEAVRDHGVELRVRIGINTGEVVSGAAAGDQRLVTGDAVNVAARLEQAATPGDVLLGEPTYRLVRDAVEVEELAPIALRGKVEGVRAYRLIEVRRDALGHERRLDSPLVDREQELELLEHALKRALFERTSHLFTLLGAAGVGKSRVVSQFVAGRGSTAAVLQGRCLSYGNGITFFPLMEVIHQASGVDETDSPRVAREKLTRLLEGVSGADRIAALIGGLLGWNEAGATEDAFWAVRKLFEHVAHEQGLVVVFDDVHWAEPTFLDLIEHLAEWTRDAAVVLLCVARPELLDTRPTWGGGKLNATSILLEPLRMDDATRLLANLLGPYELSVPLRNRILEAADGNPLFVEEMVAMLSDREVVGASSRSPLTNELVDVEVPPTIQLLLAARLDRLGAEERAVVESAAVEGNVFHTGAVTTLAPDAVRPEVTTRLVALARKELIRSEQPEFPHQDAFRFRHSLIRDAAYQGMPKERRAELHERYAAWLEHAAGDRLTEYEEILAYHLEQAYRFRTELGAVDAAVNRLRQNAVERLLRTADRAAERGDTPSAKALLERAVDIAEGTTRAKALFELALVLANLVELERSIESAKEAMKVADETGERALAARARRVYAAATGQVDPSFTMERMLSETGAALVELEALGDRAGILEAKLAVAQYLFQMGNAEACRTLTLELVSDAERLPFHVRQAIAENLTIPCYFGPTPAASALTLIEDGHRLVAGSIVPEAYRATVRAGLLAMMGLAEESRAEARRAHGIWDEAASSHERFPTYQILGEAERFLGRSDVAERIYREAIEHLTASGDAGYSSTLLGLRALALCDLERFDEAEADAKRSSELGAEDDYATQMAWRGALARIKSARGGHDAALVLVDGAIEIGEPTDYLIGQAEASRVRGTVLLAMGRSQEAKGSFEASLDLYERKGIVPESQRLRERLRLM